MITKVLDRMTAPKGEESGFSTAELLGNAAMAIIALVLLWGVVQGRGEGLINSMFDRISGG